MSYISVAIDGPAGAGKSSVSKEAAKRLGFLYVDTGAIYRSIAYMAINSGIDIKNCPQKAAELAQSCCIEIRHIDGVQHIIINKVDVTDLIRTPEVSKGASDISAIPQVRSALLSIQRRIAENNNVIMDGRDIGTVVLPNADVKIFLTASVEERARRRYSELVEKGEKCDLEKIKADIMYRDEQDSNRAAAPLKKAPDAVLVDSSDMNFEHTADCIVKLISPLL